MENSGGSWCWTNERHVDFLNSMEASFVQTMYENNDRLLPLDRYLPDSSESTLDSTKERRRRFSTSDIMDPRIRTDKKIRTPLSQSYISSQDQVVPQLENKKDDKKGRDRRGVPVTQTTPSN